jgi:hypothetical protein
MPTRNDHAAVVARAILQAVAEHLARDTELRDCITNLLADEFADVVQQTMNDLSGEQL